MENLHTIKVKIDGLKVTLLSNNTELVKDFNTPKEASDFYDYIKNLIIEAENKESIKQLFI